MSKDQVKIKSAVIDWVCAGKFSFTTGFGATKAESAIANYAALVAPVALYFLSWQDLGWTILQIVVAGLLALDMVGGVLTNSLGSMKRFLHTDQQVKVNWLGKLVGSKFTFPLIHFQLFAVPLCFDVAWSYAFFWYAAMIIAVILVHYIPLYLQRPIGLLVVMISIMISPAIPAVVGLEWLAPIFMIKLVLSHGVREEPYRPTTAQ
ncbi:hypothetical protein [Photobacterium minamisatsumaniensis]|uniref:hypothetical protein n=1 Tax=Photobacterium minamisatsumaniensis TaxID=2910233 RepID=UPI003D0A726E